MERTISKKTGTYAEALEAVGVADLLREIGFKNVSIRDCGLEYLVRANDLPLEQWRDPVGAGYVYIWEHKKEEKPPVPFLDYEGEREKRDAARKAGKKAKALVESQDIDAASGARPEIGTATILASMRKGWNADRDLALWIHAHPDAATQWVRHELGFAEDGPNEKPDLSNSQVLNPISGKGVHASKTEIRSAGSIPNQFIDPFSEWMKLRGLWRAMLLYRNDEDFKFFVIEPANIAASEVIAIHDELQKLNLWGGVRLDIHATLQCTKLLVQRSDVVQNSADSIPLRRKRPSAVIAGLRQSYFKSLGTAASLMNDALLPLPDWFAVEDAGDAALYFEVIEEVIGTGGCLSSLKEKNSDDGRILLQYREWLLTGALDDLLEFHHEFAVHLMQKLGRKDWVRPFGVEVLSRFLVRAYEKEYPMTEIIETDGFQSVARAIRNATIYALSIPNMRREVRFGLAQKWKQKIKGGNDEFTGALAEFVQEYNWETVHRLEGRGHVVGTKDLDSLIGLIQQHGAELVGALLLAYGFARAPKTEQPEDAPARA